MPFKETCRVEERIAMFRALDSGAFTAAELCESYGISRETFYVWKRRRDGGEERWFEDKPRAPGRCPHVTTPEVIERIVAVRRRFPRFGPKKIRARLALDRPEQEWPAVSTIGDILKREGLIEAKTRQRRPLPRGEIIPAGGTDDCANEPCPARLTIASTSKAPKRAAITEKRGMMGVCRRESRRIQAAVALSARLSPVRYGDLGRAKAPRLARRSRTIPAG